MNNLNQEELLLKIQELNFTVIELTQYLDTHPLDNNAIILHNQRTNELRILIDYYQKNFGPLTNECPCNQWLWNKQKWPWEKGGESPCGCTKRN